uniref:Uncharacterized protein AlNc14C29G2774 n=1 Tax=Albugo laibachii Nc14 TaxID=890382 RepID=F0W7G0_9STRA|nr:conserved hypothetical protein [Albugo laibachii Nc14]|eukprot:CCA17061.1 conserved hypothetical protein [Albugo laibachii Nc14]
MTARRIRSQSMQQFPTTSNELARDGCPSGSFVSKLYRMVDAEPSAIISWIRDGTAFCIVDPKRMTQECLPKYFRHGRFSSLIRQLNFYSFYRVQEGQLTIYQHSYFRKGRPDLLVHIKRRAAGKAKDPWVDPLAHTRAHRPSIATSKLQSAGPSIHSHENIPVFCRSVSLSTQYEGSLTNGKSHQYPQEKQFLFHPIQYQKPIEPISANEVPKQICASNVLSHENVYDTHPMRVDDGANVVQGLDKMDMKDYLLDVNASNVTVDATSWESKLSFDELNIMRVNTVHVCPIL